MKKIWSSVILFFSLTLTIVAQKPVTVRVSDSTTALPITNASILIQGQKKGSRTDSLGYTTVYITTSDRAIQVSHIGYGSQIISLSSYSDTVFVALSPEEEEAEEEIVITSTRSRRSIADIPTRVEAITGEELAEKAVMQPGNVRMLLTESTGVQTQQTSAASGSAAIRIQGLEGRYTQLLKDGFPLYAGFSGGLSILQIPPLDMKRVELIKGSASTLYGGGAIAGLVNFISKEPGDEPENSALLNINQTGALDASLFHSNKSNRWGNTIYASYNAQKEYDNNNDGLSDIPHYQRLSVNPRLFYYASKAIWQFGLNTNFENRKGGDMQVLKGRKDALHQFMEENNTRRIATLFKVEQPFGKNNLTIKNSVSHFWRQLKQPDYVFEGDQISTFTEVNLYLPRNISEWVIGGNLYSDRFNHEKATRALNENFLIAGLFVQNNLKLSDNFSIEGGLRTDYAHHYKVFVLPRLSVMYKFSDKITSRFGGGLGYKLPSAFTEESEERAFRNIAPIGDQLKPETSEGLNWDVNYRTSIAGVRLSFNQLFFYTRLHRPLILSEAGSSINPNYFYNANGYLYSRGFESNLRLGINSFSFNLGYTFINAWFDTSGITSKALLTANNRIYFTTMYEVEEKLRIAYELFYTGPQFTAPAERKRSYWVTGISAERRWKHFSLFINAENFTDTRQSRFEPVYTGTITQPLFKTIWAPTEGFIFNGGMRLFL